MEQEAELNNVRQLKPKKEADNLHKIAQLFHLSNLEKQLVGAPEKWWKLISKKHLINALNFINFQDGNILVNFRHKKYDNTLTLSANPQPCINNTLECYWTDESIQNLESYEFTNFLLSDGQELIMARADLLSIDESGVSFTLPDKSYEVSSRKVRRNSCDGIQTLLMQNGVTFSGSLVDFSAVSFCVELTSNESQSFQWVNPELQVYIILKDDNETLYSGVCEVIRQSSGQSSKTFILKPLSSQITRVKAKEFRSLRQKLSPTPNLIFTHPFTNKRTILKVMDLSGSGISVEEAQDNSVLMPGMIFPKVGIEFMNSFVINCKAQVIYRKKSEKGSVICGLAILDMEPQDQVRLSALLHQIKDSNSYVCTTNVDLDELWNFFFETGFIYPKKYAFMQGQKEEFKKTYEKLYTQNPDIAKHIIYQDKGKIYGHVSMFRFYEKTWILHHHAAKLSHSKKAGLVVAEQLGHYINEFHRMYSSHMNFLACYFRPENRFPNRVYGGVAKELNDPKMCSIDRFAYFLEKKRPVTGDLPEGWCVGKTVSADLTELDNFYEHTSGGLMMHALDLDPSMVDSVTIDNEFRKSGFKRERHLFSLKNNGTLKAVFMVNISDIGLNMSDLTNCIHAIVLDSEGFDRDILNTAVSGLSKYYKHDELPVLLFPHSFVEEKSIEYDKTYNLLVLGIEHFDHYFRQLEKLLHLVR
jgi:hypothetical protein